jgi:PAS domain S-box-containing protein
MPAQLQRQVELRSKALNESEDRLRAIVQNTPSPMHLKSADGRYLYINRGYEEMNHLPAAQAVGKTPHELYPEDLANAIQAQDAWVMHSKAALVEEAHSNGVNDRTHRMVKFPVLNAAVEISGIGAVFVDVTDYKGAERRAVDSTNQLRLITDHLPAATEYLDPQLVIQFSNPAAAQLRGRRSSELVGMFSEQAMTGAV